MMPTGKKPTRAERDQIVALVISLRGKGWSTPKIRQTLKKQYGMATRTTADYFARARDEGSKATEDRHEDLIADSLTFLEGVRADPNQSMRDRLTANDQIGDLTGIKKPRPVFIANKNGTGPGKLIIETSKLDGMSTEQLAAVESAMAAMESTEAKP